MSSRSRWIAFALVGALAGGLLLSLWLGPRSGAADPSHTAGLAFESSAQCLDCHAAVAAEWRDSPHATTWNDPAVRALSNDFANQDCIDCHAPRPVFETGIGQRVLPRAWRQAEGVDCLACHQLPADQGGGVAATRTMDAPCRPTARAELGKPELCAGCHDQHQTVQQWKASQWPARGRDCLDCHMPPVESRAGGRHHGMPGGTSLALVRQAVELRVRWEAGGWLAELENVGAGHSFPTDERSRAADVFWRPLLPDGVDRGAWRHAYRFRSPYRYETALTDTTLPAHETRSIALEQAADSGAIEVALFYKRSPYWQDPDAPDPEREAVLVVRVEAARP